MKPLVPAHRQRPLRPTKRTREQDYAALDEIDRAYVDLCLAYHEEPDAEGHPQAAAFLRRWGGR